MVAVREDLRQRDEEGTLSGAVPNTSPKSTSRAALMSSCSGAFAGTRAMEPAWRLRSVTAAEPRSLDPKRQQASRPQPGLQERGELLPGTRLSCVTKEAQPATVCD